MLQRFAVGTSVLGFVGIVGLGLVTVLQAATAPAQAPSALAIVITPGQALALPPALHGLDVVVDAAGAADPAVAAALSDIAARGGRPGLLVPAQSAPVLPHLLRAARVLLVDARAASPPADFEAAAFALKTQLTALRAAGGASLVLGLAAPAPVIEALLAQDVGPYVDLLVWMGAGVGEPTGHRIWRAALDPIPVIESLPDAMALTRRGTAERWLWRAPEPVDAAAAILRELAAPPAQERFTSGVEGARPLTVEEIIARHQAAAARQAAAVPTLISTGTLTLSFEAPGFPAPVTISADTTIFTGHGRTELQQRRIRVNGMAFQGSGVPRLPIIEPERVASPPLAITLTDVYRYRLAGRAQIGSTPCYVVEFSPIDSGEPLFTGRAWLSADDFGMVKVAAAQTGLSGPIVSSEQEDEFRAHGDGLWLLARSEVRQLYEGAAHRTPIHRVLEMATHAIDPPDFEARLQAAYASDAVMLRDTPEGYRYLRRDRTPQRGDREREAHDERAPAIEPEIAGRADRVRTLAAGVIIDPNITTPLPFAGLSYVDFDVLGTGAQVNAFFGGTYAQLAFSVPAISGSRWQLAGRAFGIASSYNDRAFEDGREQYDANILQRPAHVSVWLRRPLTPRISVRAGYDLDYTHFGAADVTAPDFVVPASQVVHGARLALDAQRNGWHASLWWNPARRAGWRAWGVAGESEYAPRHADFQRYGVSLARAAVITPRLAGRVEGAWMSGRDLDRFSRYAFGTFENRLHGYPSALIRYDRGGVVRGALAWSAAPWLRLDGFVDSAFVRDPAFGRGVRRYTGLGAALEAPAPFGLLLTAEWGYGLRGINADGSTGTHVIRVSAFKIF